VGCCLQLSTMMMLAVERWAAHNKSSNSLPQFPCHRNSRNSCTAGPEPRARTALTAHITNSTTAIEAVASAKGMLVSTPPIMCHPALFRADAVSGASRNRACRRIGAGVPSPTVGRWSFERWRIIQIVGPMSAGTANRTGSNPMAVW
jgi:hypothetical protein